MQRLFTMLLIMNIAPTPAAEQEESKSISQFVQAKTYDNRSTVCSLSWGSREGIGDNIAIGSQTSPNISAINIWNTDTDECTSTVAGPAGNIEVKYSPDGSFLVASGNSEILFLDSSTMQIQQTVEVNQWIDKTSENIFSINWSTDGNCITAGTASRSPSILIIDRRSNTLEKSLKGHTHQISSVCYSPSDQNQLASSSWDNTGKLWDLRSMYLYS